jgi:maltooligosyltrehalose trehalohydrolase
MRLGDRSGTRSTRAEPSGGCDDCLSFRNIFVDARNCRAAVFLSLLPAVMDSAEPFQRAMPIGAEVQPGGGVHFRVWAPKAQTIVLQVDGKDLPMQRVADGYAETFVASAKAGSRYGFRLDDDKKLYPDPASRSQPDGVHEASEVVDPNRYRWRDGKWKGPALAQQIIYELHIGTFTPEGTWAAAAKRLPLLADVGVTLIEMMPVAAFPGRFGWGYDGVDMFAPVRLYGEPDDLRSFIDQAHQHGIGVILDVVYNHLGPDGNYLPCFSDFYLTKKYPNEWGDALNFDGEGSGPVREFFCANAAYWVREFHFDGLRLDATQQIFDDSAEHLIAAVTRSVREAAGKRKTIVVAENEPQHSKVVRPPEQGGYGLDAMWNDDFHHSSRVALTGHAEAYLSVYSGRANELMAAARHGFLYQGQLYPWQNKPRGMPTRGVPPERLVAFIENHDQVANSGRGLRMRDLTTPGRLRAITALMLLMPQTPMLFQGQEFASAKPFLYFCDHNTELDKAVTKGRREFLLQFPSLRQVELDRPGDVETFRKCILDWSERDRHGWAVRLHKDLIALRRGDAVFALQGEAELDAAVLTSDAFVLRFYGKDDDDRLLLVNLGRDFAPPFVSEPLMAPPEQRSWHLLWSSEDPLYDGGGVRAPEVEGKWNVPGHAAVVMAAR